MIEVSGLYKAYGLNQAVRGVSFQAQKGEIVGLIGRNGAGKSTTMNMIAGYISSDEGNVWINDHDILKEPLEAKRHLGYMPEVPPLYSEMTVFKYLEFVCKLMGVEKGRIESHLKGILDEVGLEHMKNRLIGNLSKGYRQRVGIAKALCGDPENIILDEPTSGLDPQQIVEIRKVIQALGKEHTVIISSHILKELADICTRLIIIDRGRVVADDTIEHLISRSDAGRVLELNVKEPVDITKVLRAVEDVTDVTRQSFITGNANYRITQKPGTNRSEAVSRAAAAAGATILLLRPVEYSLEDVFFDLTQRTSLEAGEVR
ncbi:MAG: ABC transporter [Firmicutes bacterium HGW-Firmicutes-9]|jgi:ABC-2 type transport system ATP-binding protein|nr:MAG: ABC transporter [Firmicutes bacterium HGW-Firmicutes-9]